MRCRGVQGRLSAYRDGHLPAEEARAVGDHLASCVGCAERWRALRASLEMLGSLPRLPAAGIAVRVLDRLEVESRGPGLALLFLPFWAARPLILPSLVPAALVLVTVLAGAFALDQEMRPQSATIALSPAEQWAIGLPGTEGNPLFPSGEVSAPRIRARGRMPEARLAGQDGETTFFVETVVARDGSVAHVALLEGDSERARPYVDALREERFEPARLRGRPVAVSVYRLFSSMEVRSPAI